MSDLSKTRRKIILIHILFWIIYVPLNYFLASVQYNYITLPFIDSLAKYSIAAFIFYITVFLLLPQFLVTHKYVVLCLCILAMAFVSYIFKFFIYLLIMPLMGLEEMPYTHTEFFLMNLWWWYQYTLFAFGYWFAMESIKRERRLRIAEREKLALENAQLRAQINPHFLFNTLGYFFNKINDSHPEVAEGIISLTEIMRATIRKTDKEGLVFLQEEVENMEHLISIYQMRYNNEVYIHFEQEGDLYGLRILPHILITLVENAFKHGDIHDATSPLHITLKMNEDGLHFCVHNKKRFGPKEISHGIGVRYIQSQLESTYSASHTFLVEDGHYYYTTSIFITAAALMKKQKTLQAISS